MNWRTNRLGKETVVKCNGGKYVKIFNLAVTCLLNRYSHSYTDGGILYWIYFNSKESSNWWNLQQTVLCPNSGMRFRHSPNAFSHEACWTWLGMWSAWAWVCVDILQMYAEYFKQPKLSWANTYTIICVHHRQLVYNNAAHVLQEVHLNVFGAWDHIQSMASGSAATLHTLACAYNKCAWWTLIELVADCKEGWANSCQLWINACLTHTPLSLGPKKIHCRVSHTLTWQDKGRLLVTTCTVSAISNKP